MPLINNELKDLIGIGIGPFNLSLAALLSPVRQVSSQFFERAAGFSWHPGLLLPEAEIQVNHLQDLVTLADPTSPYSFISYLAKHKRLYRFLNSKFTQVLRSEFDMYLRWVSQSLPNLAFDEKVEEIDFNGSAFVTRTAKRTIHGRHLVLGSGNIPHIPQSAMPHLGRQVFHSENFLTNARDWRGKRVAVIGGGQSSAEIIQQILADSAGLPRQLTWVTRRSQYLPLDESPFIYEFFSPQYVEYFHQLAPAARSRMLQEQVLASDGISMHLLEAIYRRLYVLEFLEKRNPFTGFLMHHAMTAMNRNEDGYELLFADNHASQECRVNADIVILCTGYRWEFPAYLEPLRPRIKLDHGRFCVNRDYSIVWDGPEQHGIYVQNAARHTHGIADPNFCLMAWRSAKIINSIARKNIYDVDQESSAVNWNQFYESRQEWKDAVSL